MFQCLRGLISQRRCNMTVYLETKINRYNGLSSDAKPDSPPEGSTFHNIDTGEKFIFHDGTWEDDLSLIYAFNAI